MWNGRILGACAFGVALLTPGLQAQDLLPSRAIGPLGVARYRNFVLTSNLATVSAAAGMASSDAKTTHERPALLQDLEWRPSRWIPGSTSQSTDPVEQVVFSFYNDSLFRIVVDYAVERTEGMTNADMIEAIGTVYGTPNKRGGPARAASQLEIESGSVLARWGDSGYTAALYRTSAYGRGFRLILTEPALERLAQKATATALRFDEQDAPRAELARQKKVRDDSRVTAEKARAVNKAAFRP